MVDAGYMFLIRLVGSGGDSLDSWLPLGVFEGFFLMGGGGRAFLLVFLDPLFGVVGGGVFYMLGLVGIFVCLLNIRFFVVLGKGNFYW